MSKSKGSSKSGAKSLDNRDDDRKIDARSSSDSRHDNARHDRDEQPSSKRGKSNSDENKHDGRGHGNGDHNGDGHSDNGRGASGKSTDAASPAPGPTVIAGDKLMLADDVKGSVVFGGETAGYKNAVGMYTIGADGSISDVRIVFANASLKGSGGELVAGQSAVDMGLQSGQKVGFFIVPNGYAQSGNANLLSDTAGSFKLVTASGAPGNVAGGVELVLVHVSSAGKETTVKSQYGTSLFHSVDDGSMGLNGDGIKHVVTTVDPAAGTVKLAFEDLKGGGDKDFDDSIITFNVGKSNAELMALGKVQETLDARAAEAEAKARAEAEAAAKAEKLVLETKDALDVETSQHLVGSQDGDGIVGGKGNDEVFGLDGDDKLVGDRVGSVTVDLEIGVSLVNAKDPGAVSILIGNLPPGATLSAGVLNDDGTWTLALKELDGLQLTAPDASNFTLKVVAFATDGSGLVQSAALNVTMTDGNADLLVGGKGNDTLVGGLGDDVMFGGSIPTGDAKPHVATFADNDLLLAGDGNDKVWGNSGDDRLFGEAGDDALYGGKGNDALVGGAGDDTVRGNTGDDHIVDGEGNDRYEGNAGFDTLDFSGARGGMSIDMSKHTAEGMGSDTFSGIEMLVGSRFDDKIKGSKNAETIVGGEGDDHIRGLGGADTLTGGDGRDTFVFTKKDAKDGTADTITDFSKEDMLDLHDFFKGQKGPFESVVAVKDDGQSSHIYAKMGADMVEIVVLEGFSGFSAIEMLKSGMILT